MNSFNTFLYGNLYEIAMAVFGLFLYRLRASGYVYPEMAMTDSKIKNVMEYQKYFSFLIRHTVVTAYGYALTVPAAMSIFDSLQRHGYSRGYQWVITLGFMWIVAELTYRLWHLPAKFAWFFGGWVVLIGVVLSLIHHFI